MRISLSVICLGVVAGCATPQHMSTAAAARSPCEIAPSLTVCKNASIELTVQAAKQRLDAEYARLEATGEQYAREFALWSLGNADLPATSPGYTHLRDRTLQIVPKAPVETGERYFVFESIGHVANRAGDKVTAIQTIHNRRVLVRNRSKDQNWNQQRAHVITGTTKEEAWFETARDAARFGDPDLALDILNEANLELNWDTHNYQVRLAAVRVAAKQYEQAEQAAIIALDNKPYESSKDRKVYEDTVINAYKLLIESLVAQNKPIDEAVKKLRRELTDIETYLSGHSFNFYSLAIDLAEFAPSAAREFLATGKQIDQVDDRSERFPFRTTETRACKALQDDKCLLEIAAMQEAALGEHDQFLIESVAQSYADGGDLASAERLLSQTSGKVCHKFVYSAALTHQLRDGDFVTSQDWLEKWVLCQASKEPNYQTGYGAGGNLWGWIGQEYANLSQEQLKAGQRQNALTNAKAALLLALEAKNTWKLEYLGYRAEALGRAYGAAFGALVMAEQALRP